MNFNNFRLTSLKRTTGNGNFVAENVKKFFLPKETSGIFNFW